MFPYSRYANNFKLRQLKFLLLIWIFLNLIASFSSPGKSFLILPFFYFLDYKFFKKIFGGPKYNAKNLLNFKNLYIKREKFKYAFIIFSFITLLTVLTLFITDIITRGSYSNLFKFLSERVFNVSAPLTFVVIRDSNILADINNVKSEFSNIFELWFKFIFKNFFGKEYINDTIAKYIISLKGYTITGESSMTPNLLVETTVVHGRYFGSIIAIIIAATGMLIRKRLLSLNSINIFSIIAIPIIEFGPFSVL